MKIREYKSEDLDEIIELFYMTVHYINSKDYTEKQLKVWAPPIDKIPKKLWDESLQNHYTIIVEDNNKILGFGDIDNTGYLDRLYVHKDFQKQGIASMISNKLEKYAKKLGCNSLTTHASITAKPFFEKRNYKTIKKQKIIRKNQILINYIMKKDL